MTLVYAYVHAQDLEELCEERCRYHRHRRADQREFESERTNYERFLEAIHIARIKTVATGKAHVVWLDWGSGNTSNDWFKVLAKDAVVRSDYLTTPHTHGYQAVEISIEEAQAWLEEVTTEAQPSKELR